MKTQLALRVHEDVAVRHNGCCYMQMLADRALYDWQARLQRVSVVVALAPAHREVTALDNVLVEDARVCGGHWHDLTWICTCAQNIGFVISA